MLCPVLKRFPYSTDGVTSKIAEAGTEVDLPSVLVPGLQREGFIGPSIPLQSGAERSAAATADAALFETPVVAPAGGQQAAVDRKKR